MNNYKIPPPIKVNNVEVPADLQLIIEDIIKAYNEKRLIGIYRNDPNLKDKPDENDEQKIIIRLKVK